jgi:hypothetical protein
LSKKIHVKESTEQTIDGESLQVIEILKIVPDTRGDTETFLVFEEK